MQQKRAQKGSGGAKSAPRGQQLTSKPKPSAAATESKAPASSQAKKEKASKAADAGAAPEQNDAEPD